MNNKVNQRRAVRVMANEASLYINETLHPDEYIGILSDNSVIQNEA